MITVDELLGKLLCSWCCLRATSEQVHDVVVL